MLTPFSCELSAQNVTVRIQRRDWSLRTGIINILIAIVNISQPSFHKNAMRAEVLFSGPQSAVAGIEWGLLNAEQCC